MDDETFISCGGQDTPKERSFRLLRELQRLRGLNEGQGTLVKQISSIRPIMVSASSFVQQVVLVTLSGV